MRGVGKLCILVLPILLGCSSDSEEAIDCLVFASTTNSSRWVEGNLSTEQPWCYYSDEQNHTTVIFNYQNEQITPELAVFIQSDEKGNLLSVRHYNRAFGKSEMVEQSDAFFNPMPIDWNYSIAQTKALRSFELEPSESLLAQIEALHSSFTQSQVRQLNPRARFTVNTTEPKVESVYLPEERQPKDGYWWPFSSLSEDSDSPLAKYDQYVLGVTGSDPKSRIWETDHHGTNVSWGGHCNGWAASAILDGFFGHHLWDPNQQKTISPSDIQGMRSETGYCVQMAFYGIRNNGWPIDPERDLTPDLFHKVLRYYLKYLRKPVIADMYSSESVDNNIISGYKMTATAGDNRTVKIEAEVKIHYYSYALVDEDRVASSYSEFYEYELFFDDRGKISGGRWLSPHPDFLWVPLAQSLCGSENPHVRPEFIDQMIRTLPRQ